MNFPAVVVSWPLFALFVRWSAASVPHQRKSVPERCTYCLSGWCWWNSSCTKEIAFGSFVLWLASYSFGNRDLYPAHRIHYCQLRSGKQRFIIAIYAPVTVHRAVNLLNHFRIPTSRSHALCTYFIWNAGHFLVEGWTNIQSGFLSHSPVCPGMVSSFSSSYLGGVRLTMSDLILSVE